jgi:hypothetical protein
MLRNISKDITIEQRDEYWKRSELYRTWLLDSVFKASDVDTVKVMVFPIEVGQPNYRESDIP